MTIIPAINNILVGSTATYELQDYSPDAIITVSSSNITVATCSYSNGIITVVGVTAGEAVITATDGVNSASCGVTVTSPSAFIDLTEDGSGTGNDTNVFGRQYIINNNLKRVNDIINVMSQTLNTIRTLSISNQVTNAAAIAGIAANVVLTINMLSSMSVASGSVGKNTVTIG